MKRVNDRIRRLQRHLLALMAAMALWGVVVPRAYAAAVDSPVGVQDLSIALNTRAALREGGKVADVGAGEVLENVGVQVVCCTQVAEGLKAPRVAGKMSASQALILIDPVRFGADRYSSPENDPTCERHRNSFVRAFS